MIQPETLAELWRTHSSRLLLIARSTGEPAEDAVQEAFTSLAAQQDLPNDPLAWLVKTARNWLIRHHRKRTSHATYLATATIRENWFASPSDHIDSHLDSKQVTQWLQALPSDEREVIAMHLWGNMTFRQIASAMDCSPATANRIYHSGLERLRLRAHPANKVCHE